MTSRMKGAVNHIGRLMLLSSERASVAPDSRSLLSARREGQFGTGNVKPCRHAGSRSKHTRDML